ncbi:hypothetical protein [Deinococcus sp. QL22]|nr:hypothetical protein [Deinococcus sp. QL22]
MVISDLLFPAEPIQEVTIRASGFDAASIRAENWALTSSSL